jgi:diadenylate cyclase
MDYVVQIATQAFQYLLSIEIKDIIDIGILSFIIYKVLRLMRKTRAGGVVRGLLGVFAAVALSTVLQFNALNFLLSRLIELGFIALIVVFQPEIRRLLEQMGQISLSGLMGRRQGDPGQLEEAIYQTVKAYASMSRDKVGALMVFERKNSMDECIKSGTAMDAAINEELLKNLFWNKAPLHDGAVIVRNGRIIGAGCMLPMSGNVNLSRDLGMRHRAGIGISEQSDAVVAIVSEETGAISVAVGGMLKRHLAPETLERVLLNELMPKQAEDKQNSSKVGQLVGRLVGRKDGAKND